MMKIRNHSKPGRSVCLGALSGVALVLGACAGAGAERAMSSAQAGHHVLAGSGKPLAHAYFDCVNTGYPSAGAHGCGAAAAANTETPAPTTKPAPAPAAPPQRAPLEITKGEVVHAPVEQLSLQADALFVFGRSDGTSLLPAGKQRLDEFAARLTQMQESLAGIEVVGHADRLGAEQLNLSLSQSRALTVKNYLAAKGVPDVYMRATGLGESAPLVACPGEKPNPKLKACLAANRRVEVVVYGRK
jgi:outer membrane protein OmpA-like peptidoglycan-associated protein